MKITKDFTCKPSNEGLQVLLHNDKHINVIVRNQQRQSRETKKYKITIEEIKDQDEIKKCI